MIPLLIWKAAIYKYRTHTVHCNGCRPRPYAIFPGIAQLVDWYCMSMNGMVYMEMNGIGWYRKEFLHGIRMLRQLNLASQWIHVEPHAHLDADSSKHQIYHKSTKTDANIDKKKVKSPLHTEHLQTILSNFTYHYACPCEHPMTIKQT